MEEFDPEALAQLVKEVAEATEGTRSDPLTREEVQEVVIATLRELQKEPEAYSPLI